MSQLITNRSGGSNASTRAHRHSEPSSPRSKTAPPAYVSNTVSAIGTPNRLCSRGLIRSNCSVNTWKARSADTSTTIWWRTAVSSVVDVMGTPPFSGRLPVPRAP